MKFINFCFNRNGNHLQNRSEMEMEIKNIKRNDNYFLTEIVEIT